MVSFSRELTRKLKGINFEMLSAEVVEHTQFLILDLIGVALAANNTPEAQMLRKSFSNAQSIRCEGSVMWGRSDYASAPDAALYNGTLAHALELDDFGGADHSGAVVFPALMALLDGRSKVSGKKFIEATVIGYEVCRRILEAAGAYRAHNSDGGWHSTATCGSPGAAVAAAYLLDLNEDQIVSALGFAATMIGGTWAFNADGAMSKRIHPGWAAHLGVNAAFFAEAGIKGPEFCFEADWGGFFNTYAAGSKQPEKLLKDFGSKYKILRSGIKPYPCCRDNHSVIDVMLNLHAQLRGDLSSIRVIQIFCIPEMFKMLSNADPKSTVEAQLSLPFSAAVALVNGHVKLEQFASENLGNECVKRVVNQIQLHSSTELEFDAEPIVKIHYLNGEVETKTVPFAKGAPQNPLSREEILNKFEDLTKDTISSETRTKIINTIMTLQNCDDVNSITELLKVTSKRGDE